MKVLIAVDGTDDAFAAVRFASSLRLDDAEVVLLNVAEPDVVPLTVVDGLSGIPAAPVVGPADDDPTTERETAWASFRRAAAAIDVETVAVETAGSPSDAIISTAERLAVDLVVVGTRDAGLLERLFDPSVARNVVAHAPCSVLVVR